MLGGDLPEAAGPDPALVASLLQLVKSYGERRYLPGDRLQLLGLQDRSDLTLMSSVVGECTVGESTKWEEIVNIAVTVRIQPVVLKRPAELLETVAAWLVAGREDKVTVTRQTVAELGEEEVKIRTTLQVDSEDLPDIAELAETLFDREFSGRRMEQEVREGVCYVQDKIVGSTYLGIVKVGAELVNCLRKNIASLAEKTGVDLHPGSGGVVRDLVHPALYSYIRNVSRVKSPLPAQEEQTADYWGRMYEDSQFQWIPSPFLISEEGKCSIMDYINNLDRKKFSALYTDLEKLFGIFLPYMEEIWSYARAMEFWREESEDVLEPKEITPFEKQAVSLRGRELQVITKIVQYSLQPGQTYEGVWHVEGMSHENIVMTGLYCLDQDPGLHGAELQFKRAFTLAERTKVFLEISQGRPAAVDRFASEGVMPLGCCPAGTPGCLLVFPNCHIHRLVSLTNCLKQGVATRSIIVFFLVNPDRRIVSTREVAPQQSELSLDAAQQYRLQLMEERKWDKLRLNVRDIELCEH